jgi:hypothetical protein
MSHLPNIRGEKAKHDPGIKEENEAMNTKAMKKMLEIAKRLKMSSPEVLKGKKSIKQTAKDSFLLKYISAKTEKSKRMAHHKKKDTGPKNSQKEDFQEYHMSRF